MEIPQSGEDLETNPLWPYTPTMQGYDELRDGAAWLDILGWRRRRMARALTRRVEVVLPPESISRGSQRRVLNT
jgi:hypothetical protein